MAVFRLLWYWVCYEMNLFIFERDVMTLRVLWYEQWKFTLDILRYSMNESTSEYECYDINKSNMSKCYDININNITTWMIWMIWMISWHNKMRGFIYISSLYGEHSALLGPPSCIAMISIKRQRQNMVILLLHSHSFC